jgi:pyruvate kinase
MATALHASDDVAAAADLDCAIAMLRADVLGEGAAILDRWRPRIRRDAFLPSARNLAHYIALRHHDLRGLQAHLIPWGMSSLGRCEARVLETLDAVGATAARLAGSTDPPQRPSYTDFYRGDERLRDHTAAALGPRPANRGVRIMVTLSTAAASDRDAVRALVASGMDIARINCAHDDADAWRAMIAHVRRAAGELGRSCLVCMDLSGPRSRTGAVHARDGSRLGTGDRFVLTAGPPRPREHGLAHIECSLVEAVAQLRVGGSMWLDEGRLGAVVERRLDADALLLRVTQAPDKGVKPRPNKGLNFPDTELRLRPLTAKDLRDLDVVARTADIVGYSFVQRPEDIALLQDELAARDAGALALVAKIETATAARNLPELIVQAAGVQPLAVMIARGDLAVEIGHRRLAEMQEELLWLCEAAHVPVIWATQVLDTLVKKGVRTRAEITDAAMAERAECVMLNKGPHAAEAVAFLDDVLRRMEGHQYKKAARMRALRSW